MLLLPCIASISSHLHTFSQLSCNFHRKNWANVVQLCGTRVKPQSWTWAGLPVTQREPRKVALRRKRTNALISNCLVGIASFLGKVLKSKSKELCWDGGDSNQAGEGQHGKRQMWAVWHWLVDTWLHRVSVSRNHWTDVVLEINGEA